MMTRRSSVVTVLLVLCGCVATTPVARGRDGRAVSAPTGRLPAGKCSDAALHSRRGRRVIAESARVLVYASRRGRFDDIWMCRKQHGRSRYLTGVNNFDDHLFGLQISGAYVGFAIQRNEADGVAVEVESVDSRTGRRGQFTEGTMLSPGSPPVGSESDVDIADFVVNRAGDAAWISHTTIAGAGNATTRTFEIWVMHGLKARPVAQSRTIDATSLALTTSLIYWTDGGTPRSAPISGGS